MNRQDRKKLRHLRYHLVQALKISLEMANTHVDNADDGLAQDLAGGWDESENDLEEYQNLNYGMVKQGKELSEF